MPFVIGEEQTCGVASRNIQENIMLLRDVIDFANWNNREACLLSIDQKKAFDRISWFYMFTVMETLGIPSTLIKWIKVMYSNPYCSNPKQFYWNSYKG